MKTYHLARLRSPAHLRSVVWPKLSVLGAWLFTVAAMIPATPQAAVAPAEEEKIANQRGTLEVCENRVLYQKKDGEETPARPPQELDYGDSVHVLALSRALGRYADDSGIDLAANTLLRIERLTPRTGRGRSTQLNLRNGSMRVISRSGPVSVPFSTLNSVSGIPRGTEYVVTVEGNQTIVTMFDGEVELSDGQTNITVRSGYQAIAAPNQGISVRPFLRATNLVQWWIYYPSVLDPDELSMSPAEQAGLAASLAAYRRGDVLSALRAYPGYPRPVNSGGAVGRAYLAILLLGVGAVEEARVQLQAIPAPNPLKRAVLKMAAAVTDVAVTADLAPEDPSPKSKTGPRLSASEWIAVSYQYQAVHDLPKALAAARRAIERSPSFGFGWSRVAELEFSFGRTRRARAAMDRALTLTPENPEAHALRGFLLAAEGSIRPALAAFERAIELDPALANAWLGRGLCKRRLGWFVSRAERGWAEDIRTAALLEPDRSLLRSYCGKAFAEAGDSLRAAKEFKRAVELDTHDPTPWLYSSLLLAEQNRINQAIESLEESVALNTNRSLFRSRLLLDQDRAVRSANLARIYQDDGMESVATRTAIKAVESDYANYSAHLFLAESYDALRDPGQVNQRYETAWLSEYLVANLLAPVQVGALSPMVSQQEYGRLFEHDRLGLTSLTRYSSQGDWLQAAVQYGQWSRSAYAMEETYRSRHGDRPNNDQEQLTLSLRFKQEVSPQDSLFFQCVSYNDERGDLIPYYDPASANSSLRVTEKQEPLLVLGYHHEWTPGIHTLALVGRLDDTLTVTNAAASTLFFQGTEGVREFGTYALYGQDYWSQQEIYTGELQQLFQIEDVVLVLGGRYQGGQIETANQMANGRTYPGGTTISRRSFSQQSEADLERVTAYGYTQWRPAEPLLLVGGLAYDQVTCPGNFRFAPITLGEQTRDQVGPKAGLVWTPAPTTTLRGAYTRSLGGVSLDQSFQLEPSQVAGMNQAFRSVTPEAIVGSLSAPAYQTLGGAWEQQLPSRTYLGAGVEWLQSDLTQTVGAVDWNLISGVPTGSPLSAASTRQSLDYEERTLWATANQLLTDNVSLGASYRLSQANLERSYVDLPSSIDLTSPLTSRQSLEATLHQVRLYGIVNVRSGLFGGAEGLWTTQSSDGYSPALPGDDFWQINLFAGYRFWRRQAELRLALLNLTGQDYRLNPLNLTAELPRSRTLSVSLRLCF